MNIPTHTTLIQRALGARQKQLQAQSPVLAACLVTLRRTCGKSSRRCAQGHKHLGHYLTRKEHGKTHSAHVPQALRSQVQQWQQEYRRLKRLLAEVSPLSLAVVTPPPPASPGGKILKLGGTSARTLRHFFPELNAWLDVVPDTRFQPFVAYHRRFLLWLALLVFTLRLGSRRQIAFDLRAPELCLPDNFNRLAVAHPGGRLRSTPKTRVSTPRKTAA